VTVDRLGVEGISSRRNQTLMTLLEDAVVPEERRVVCENRGTGIGAILAALRQAGMGPPSFENQIATFRITFPNHTLLDEETLQWLARSGGFDLTDSQRMGLALARHGDPLTNDWYRRFTDVDSRVATHELGDLVRRGLLQRDGSHRWTTYRVVPERPVVEHEPIPPTRPEPAPKVDRPARADRRPAILALLAEHGELSRAEIAAALRLSDWSINRWLSQLLQQSAVELTTQSKSSPLARYRLSDQTEPS
jgi:ATP-dependent DNA helicase RecG